MIEIVISCVFSEVRLTWLCFEAGGGCRRPRYPAGSNGIAVGVSVVSKLQTPQGQLSRLELILCSQQSSMDERTTFGRLLWGVGKELLLLLLLPGLESDHPRLLPSHLAVGQVDEGDENSWLQSLVLPALADAVGKEGGTKEQFLVCGTGVRPNRQSASELALSVWKESEEQKPS